MIWSNGSALRLSLSAISLACAAGGYFLHSGEPKAREMENHPIVQLRALDKITARTVTFQVDVGAIVKFGSLYVKAQSCRKAPPIEQPESAAFLQIWEEKAPKNPHASTDLFERRSEWVFSGWMFASSPALSYMDHPIYDVWVMDCLKEADAPVSLDDEGALLEGEGTVNHDTHAPVPEAENEDNRATQESTPTLHNAIDNSLFPLVPNNE